MSVLQVPVSWFTKYNDSSPAGEITLLRWLQSDKLRSKVEAIRQIADKNERDRLKASLPAITASGTFSRRSNSALLKHSGFICLDIDLKENSHILNYNDLKAQMANIIQVAYCGLSVSGTGFFVLIPIAYTEKHLHHFFALQKLFASFGINIDNSCKDLSRLRGYSWNESAYFNHNAKPFECLFEPLKNMPQVKTLSTFKYDGTPVWEQYNRTGDFEQLLLKHGWRIEKVLSYKTFYSRPGKTSGISAEFHHDLRIFYVFTSSTGLEPKGYSPAAVYAILEHGGDFKKAAKELTAMH